MDPTFSIEQAVQALKNSESIILTKLCHSHKGYDSDITSEALFKWHLISKNRSIGKGEKNVGIGFLVSVSSPCSIGQSRMSFGCMQVNSAYGQQKVLLSDKDLMFLFHQDSYAGICVYAVSQWVPRLSSYHNLCVKLKKCPLKEPDSVNYDTTVAHTING